MTRTVPSFHRFLQSQFDSVDTYRSDFLGTVEQFSDAMDETPPFSLGNGPSLVDFVMAPWAIRVRGPPAPRVVVLTDCTGACLGYKISCFNHINKGYKP